MSTRLNKNMASWVIFTMAIFPLCSCSSNNQKVDFETRKPDEKKIQQQLDSDAKKLHDWKPNDQEKRVVKLFRQANLLSVSVDTVAPDKISQTINSLRMSTKSCLISAGKPSMVKLGLGLLADFEKEFKALCDATAKVPGASLALLSGAPPPEAIKDQFRSFAKTGGGFLVVAAANGLLRQADGGALEASPGARFIMRTAFKVYWSNALPQSVEPLDWVLSPFERKWYEIWIVERSKTAPMARKVAALRYLAKNVREYPAERAKGVILYKAKKYTLARKAFKLALQKNPKDKRAKMFLAEAKKMIPN